jgi:predicted HTH domain antitoxin
MDNVPYPLRVPRALLELAKLKAKNEHSDQTTALRQLLYRGAEEYVLSQWQAGHISIGRAAELLHLTIYDMHDLAQARRLDIGPTSEERDASLQTLTRLLGTPAVTLGPTVREGRGVYIGSPATGSGHRSAQPRRASQDPSQAVRHDAHHGSALNATSAAQTPARRRRRHPQGQAQPRQSRQHGTQNRN